MHNMHSMFTTCAAACSAQHAHHLCGCTLSTARSPGMCPGSRAPLAQQMVQQQGAAVLLQLLLAAPAAGPQLALLTAMAVVPLLLSPPLPPLASLLLGVLLQPA